MDCKTEPEGFVKKSPGSGLVLRKKLKSGKCRDYGSIRINYVRTR